MWHTRVSALSFCVRRVETTKPTRRFVSLDDRAHKENCKLSHLISNGITTRRKVEGTFWIANCKEKLWARNVICCWGGLQYNKLTHATQCVVMCQSGNLITFRLTNLQVWNYFEFKPISLLLLHLTAIIWKCTKLNRKSSSIILLWNFFTTRPPSHRLSHRRSRSS